MTVASRIRPIDLEDLSHLDSVGGPFDDDESASAATTRWPSGAAGKNTSLRNSVDFLSSRRRSGMSTPSARDSARRHGVI